MKRSGEPTPYIMILADTASEWDNCDFAVIHLTEEWKGKMRERLAEIERFGTDEELCSLLYWDAPVGFYQNNDEDENGTPKDLLNEDEVWCYITLEDGEPENLVAPESRLGTFMLTVYPYGTATYNAIGKHSGEEYWTEAFDISRLTNSEKANVLLTAKSE
ncbi:hypothetical protein LJ707_02330 [Mucilaginibacter sp. UR6-1]|uniref:hypothetical protein n=1 Tax=Mucilaginibacter sp. UR6-1 TaxID=1435643 RepID=UPI001E37DD22|nr:hypothetical protein [Mucilaginibacter sp. UR6-1]MCC8407749.1 hypothetical protein [Mucilaginibacter sp. UR6-1]